MKEENCLKRAATSLLQNSEQMSETISKPEGKCPNNIILGGLVPRQSHTNMARFKW